MIKTIRQLVDGVHTLVTNEGMDLSPHDVGHIVALFFEGMAHHPSCIDANVPLQRIADECEAVV